MELDEFGIPTGEHRATCGCEFIGRGLLKACEEHHDLVYFGLYK